jgi:hypothetical protein
MIAQLLQLGISISISCTPPTKIEVRTNEQVSFFSDKEAALVVTFEKFSVKQFTELEAKIADIKGLKLMGSCSKLNCYYFSYDTSILRTENEAFDALLIGTKEYQPLLKSETSVTDVERACLK